MESRERNDEPLPPAKATYLNSLLHHLRHKQGIKYVALAAEIGVDVDELYEITGRKHPGDETILGKVLKFYQNHGIAVPSSGELNAGTQKGSGDRGFGYLIEELGLNADRIAGSESLEGKYLLFSFVRDSRIAVTWLELRGPTAHIPFPTFTARRPRADGAPLITKGLYYEYMRSLFLFGHIADTPFARSLVLVPMGSAARPRDRRGIIVGASSVESLFASTCYLRFAGRQTSWRKHQPILGDHDPEVLHTQFPDVVDFMRLHSSLTASVIRMSG